MHEIEMKVKPLSEMKEKLISWSKSELEKGAQCVDTKEMGEVIDMIKDLAEAEEKCIKACYYKTVIEAMGEYEETDYMGYDNWRTSSGRFANKGTGNYRPSQSGRHGYMYPVEPEMLAEGTWNTDYGPWEGPKYRHVMGYDNPSRTSSNYSQNGQNGGNSGTRSSGEGSNNMGYTDPDMERYMRDNRHGKAYKDWQLSRKHYTETHSEDDKHEMSEHAKEHMADTVMTIKEIWMDATPELRAKMKADLSGLMSEMK